MSPRGSSGHRPDGASYGPPGDDPLAARLFPPLPGVVRWGLERTEHLLSAVGSPHRAYPVLHVGGTNGKGSVAALWDSILRAAGFRTGLYTSPHVMAFRERFQVDGRPLPDAMLEGVAGELRGAVIDTGPSYFEASTALAFLAFERAEVEVAVVEVGLGGRLDATNVVLPLLTAITQVSLDHREYLGDVIEGVAREKAGILKAGVPAFTSARDPAVIRVLLDEAAARGVPLTRVRPPRGEVSVEGIRCNLPTRRWGALELRCPLVGLHQLENLALAVRALEALPPRLLPGARAVIEGVEAVRIRGRFQVENDPPRTWVLDAAHNPAAAAALAATLGVVELPRPRVALVGILADKDRNGMIREIVPAVDRTILTAPPSAPPSRRWEPVAGEVCHLGREIRIEPDFERALDLARDATAGGGTVVVTGSFHTVGDTLRTLGRVPGEGLPPPVRSG